MQTTKPLVIQSLQKLVDNFDNIVLSKMNSVHISALLVLLWGLIHYGPAYELYDAYIYQICCLVGVVFSFYLYQSKTLWTVITICLYSWNQDLRALKLNARILLALVFGFATFWKIWGGEYLDASFFEVTFFSDSRLHKFAQYIIGYDKDVVNINHHIISNYNYGPNLGVINSFKNSLVITDRCKLVANILAYTTIILEGLVSLLFIIKPKLKYKALADYVLLLFIVGVYWLLLVPGFGMILIVLGLLQNEDKRLVKAYMAALVILAFYDWSYVKFN